MKFKVLSGLVLACLSITTAVAPDSVEAESRQLLPNLVAMPAQDLGIVLSGDQKLLRFSTLSWNNGDGPLELLPGDVALVEGKQRQKVVQRVYDDDGNWSDESLSTWMKFHEGHSHFHLDDYANYYLLPADGSGSGLRTGTKTSFCILDTTRINTKLPGAPKKSVYSTCNPEKQGMSVGWGDTYGYRLEGQSLDITGLADGTYVLRIVIDPKDHLLELEDVNDNTADLTIQISGTSVSIPGNEGPRRGRR